ncbi:hypothetical protein ALC56_11812 [Trachymyrmex septentrionalis]|uniref:Uncharacterized protein n=1 Tax=Trachymyrmex septentrionalis TaxID=34720 RepID=A0A151JTG9_9HYME|nr:hypothetical protein ALC56_11812 [Trachymyrmex septentrionalis]
MYVLRVDGKKDTKKRKSVKSNIVARSITFNDYTRCLNDTIKMTRRQSCIRSKLHEVRGLFKKYREFCVFSKIIYLFMNIYFVPFKVIPIRYYTLVPTFFPILEALQKIIFCDLVQLLLRCRLYLLNRSVASSFHGPLQFREQEKVTGGQIWGIRWLRHH